MDAAVRDPSGRDNRNFRRNIRADGTGEYVFESAFNDPVGTWTLVVKHVNTGETESRRFAMRSGDN